MNQQLFIDNRCIESGTKRETGRGESIEIALNIVLIKILCQACVKLQFHSFDTLKTAALNDRMSEEFLILNSKVRA